MVEANGSLRPLQPRPNTRDTLELLGNGCLADAAFGHSHGQGLECLRTVLQGTPVQAEEDLGGEQTRSLVAVNERMVRDDVKQVCGRHVEEPGVYVRPSEGCLRLCNGGLWQSAIANAGSTAETLELALVERQHDLNSQELNPAEHVAHWASFLYVSSWASIISSAAVSARSSNGTCLSGRMISPWPSVVTSSGVSLVMSRSSRIGRSIMSPRLLPTTDSFFGTVATLLLWNGVIFQLPAVMYLLARLGVVTTKWLGETRRYALVVITIVAALITPTGDPYNLLLLAIPMYLLYELGIILTRLVPKPATPVNEDVATA